MKRSGNRSSKERAEPLPIMDEDDVLISWGMRFDGYLYQRDTGFDPDRFNEKFFEEDSLDWAEPLDCLAAFFCLQRYLYKFGGERLEKTSPEWRMFRKLFLDTARIDVPERYRGSELWYGEWYERWLAQSAPQLEQHVSLIERIDRETIYEASSPLMGSG